MIPRFNLQWEADNSSHPRMAQYEHGLYVRTADHLAKIRELESTLAAERASRLQCPECDFPYVPISNGPTEYVCAFCNLLEDNERLDVELKAERASRVQADTEQFNAGIERAAQYVATMAAYPYANPLTDDTKSILSLMPNGIRNCAKPSVSPEQEKP